MNDPFDMFFEKITWDSKLSFGKYKSETLESILEKDAKYLDWLLESCQNKQLKDFLVKNKTRIWQNIPDDDSYGD